MSTITNTEIADILNDLIRINNDRVHWYERILGDLRPEDSDLEGVFQTNLRKLRSHNEFLEEEVRDLELNIINGCAAAEENVFKGNNRHAILMNCEAGGIAAERAYQRVLENPMLPGYLKELLGEQREELEKMRRRIEALKSTAL